MANVRVDVNYTIKDGSEIVFRSPVDCSAITGLIVYYPAEDGNTTSKELALADAHGNNVGDIDHLFAENVVVKVILDVTHAMAFVQNADTNAYIERTFIKTVNGVAPDENGNVVVEVPEGGGGSGVTVAEKELILSLFKNTAYTADMSATIAQLEALWSGSGDEPDAPVEPDEPVIPVYTVTNNLTGVTNSNPQTEVTEGFYSASLSWESGYELNSITITMGGVDITADVYGEGNILITEVTGDIVITAKAGLPAPVYLLENKTFDGSAGQIIDTGISLFDSKQKDWSIYIALTTDDETRTSSRTACWHKSVESTYPIAASVSRGQWVTNWFVNAVTSQYKVSDTLAKCAAIITHTKGENGLKYYGVVGGEIVTGDVACRGYGTDGTLKIGGAYNYEETTEAGLFIGTINTAEVHLRVLTEAEIKEKLGVA